MKIVVLMVHLWLFGDVEEELSFVQPSMEECLKDKERRLISMLGFPVERIEIDCVTKDAE